MSTVFQYRPGAERSANLTVANTDVLWEAPSAGRAGTLFNNTGNAPGATQVVNLLDAGDLYGEGLRMFDLKFAKNIRFARRRLNVGVDVFNLFNSDAALGYNSTYTAFRVVDANGNSTWVEDNPATANVESNTWGRVTNITTARHFKLSVAFDF